MMGNVFYDYVTVMDEDLAEIIHDINDCQDKIVSATQNGRCYTIFYERRGNEKGG